MSPSDANIDEMTEIDMEPPSIAEKIFYQALADYEKSTDPAQLHGLLDLQRRRKSLLHEDEMPLLTTDNHKSGPFVSGSNE